ncbi:MAG: phage tail tip lysozyme [Eubacteriales bacterium]|nr:phage tail tip lysozyme [Eubacteriales bacterium]
MTEKEIYEYLTSQGMTPAGAAGMMGNLYAESGLISGRVEMLCLKRLSENGKIYNDATYTAAVDNCKISRAEFLNPLPGKQYGYGLAQWTSPGRKGGLYDLVRSKKVSISDCRTQLEYLMQELKTAYTSVLEVLKTAKTVKQASDVVLVKFERPANVGESVKTARARYGQAYYDKYAGKGGHMISNCGHDENGRYSGGKAGDQKGDEWAVINWYNRPWNVMLRHPESRIQGEIARLARDAARNNKVGYDQAQRYTFWEHLKASNYEPSQITINCEADCSSGVAAIVRAIGYKLNIQKLKDVSIYAYTGNLRAVLKQAGFQVFTDSKYRTSPDYLLPGDILLYEGHHVATNLDRGKKVSGGTANNSGTTTNNENGKVGTCKVELKSFGLNAADAQFKTVQRILNALGYKGKDGLPLTIDGENGPNSQYATTCFQKDKKLSINTYGTVAAKTWAALLNA